MTAIRIWPTDEERQQALEEAFKRASIRRSASLPSIDIAEARDHRLQVLEQQKISVIQESIAQKYERRFFNAVERKIGRKLNSYTGLKWQNRWLSFVELLVRRKLEPFRGKHLSMDQVKRISES